MFKVAMSPDFWAPVEFEFTDERGRRQVAKFEVRVPRMSTDEFEAFRDRIQRDGLDDRTVAREIVLGFRGVQGDDGEPLDFDRESLERVLNVVGAPSAIAAAFFANLGRARVKN